MTENDWEDWSSDPEREDEEVLDVDADHRSEVNGSVSDDPSAPVSLVTAENRSSLSRLSTALRQLKRGSTDRQTRGLITSLVSSTSGRQPPSQSSSASVSGNQRIGKKSGSVLDRANTEAKRGLHRPIALSTSPVSHRLKGKGKGKGKNKRVERSVSICWSAAHT
jgi:hypothetical protein